MLGRYAISICAAAAMLAAPSARADETTERGATAHLSPYGVCAHISRGDEHPVARRELQAMRAAGIAWVRTDFSWSGVERRPGDWDFAQLDETVDWAEAAGVEILPILDYDVPWARPAHEHLDKWLVYVRRIVKRYKDRLRYWEVWNEPNLQQFWHDKPDPKAYAKMLRATYDAIKQIDPELVVLFGGTAEIPWSFIEGVYQSGGAETFNVMNVHPYRYPAAPEQRPLYEDLLRLRRLMEKYGDGDKPIWATEVGWPTHEGPRGVSLPRQAQMLARCYLLSLQAGVEVVFWYEFQAPEERADYNEHHFGIVHRDISPKPAYAAMAALTRARPSGSKAVERPWRTGDVYHPAWQRPDGETAWALWRVGDDHGYAVQIEGAVAEAFDHLGQPVDLDATTGSVRLTLGEGPIYLIGPAELTIGQAAK
ncbi:MAG: beta-galactosidase [Pirellulales bacterium]|nr:beta-galactosidase [Pirellulales bacterium]